LFYLESADEEDFVFGTSGLKKVAKLEMMDIDPGWDDFRASVDVLDAASHCGELLLP